MIRIVALTLFTLAASTTLLDGDELWKTRVKLRSGDKWTRKSAVEALAELDRVDAWALVVEALADRKGEVADTAQLVLAGLDEREELELVYGSEGLRNRDEWVRRRVAELFGRLSVPVDPRQLVRALGDSDADVRRSAAWSVERLARAGRLPDGVDPALRATVIRKATKGRDAGVRARSLLALSALDPEACRPIAREAASDRAAEVRCAVAALAPTGFAEEEATSCVERLAADTSRAVRVQAIESLAALGSKSALLALVDRLDVESEERVLVRLVELLRALSGRKHRRDARPWRAWAEELPVDWRPADAPETVPSDDGSQSVTFGGLPILSKRLAFLIDMSGSMWSEIEDGRTLKEVVEGMLAEVFERLSADTRFNVLPYTEKPRPWKKRIVAASPSHVRSAKRFFEDCSDQGTGNFWSAAMAALEDPEVDTLVVLTDGDPTGGRRHRLELMVPLFAELNATRKVAVDSILIDSTRYAQRHWARLAEESGGRSIHVEM